jgi:hypothetical protein
MSPLQTALDQITFARRYTVNLLDSVPEAEWFRMPAGGVTHVAWQVGHLAIAQYRMALERLRGRRPDDGELISDDFLRQFGAGSVPEPDPAKYPVPGTIRAVFDRVHQRVLAEVKDFPEGELGAPPTREHRLAKTKLECLFWCAHHEMVHAGQIGLLRRLLGQAPQW